PTYILIWIVSIMLSGGYDKPIKEWKAIRGTLWGTAIILILYALLPEEYRFSRALILIGAAWVLAAIVLLRQVLRLIRADWFGIDAKRMLIIGKPDECKRVHSLLAKTNIKIEAVQYLSPEEASQANENMVNAWSDRILVYNINEVVFCAKDISSQLIMDAMSSIPRPELEFKIAPAESWAVIGSNTIHTTGQLYMIDVHAINRTAGVRDKRLLDLLCSLLFLAFGPLFIWVQKEPIGYMANIFKVLFGSSSWVGYAHPANEKVSQHLPKIKPGVLSP